MDERVAVRHGVRVEAALEERAEHVFHQLPARLLGRGADDDAPHVGPTAHRLGESHLLARLGRRADAQREAEQQLECELARLLGHVLAQAVEQRGERLVEAVLPHPRPVGVGLHAVSREEARLTQGERVGGAVGRLLLGSV